MLKAVYFILTSPDLWPYPENAGFATPTPTRTALRLLDSTAVLIGDATGSRLQNPPTPDMHSLVYPEDKSCTAQVQRDIRWEWVLVRDEVGVSGSTSDPRLHEVDGVGKRFAGDGSGHVVL